MLLCNYFFLVLKSKTVSTAASLDQPNLLFFVTVRVQEGWRFLLHMARSGADPWDCTLSRKAGKTPVKRWGKVNGTTRPL